MNPMNNQNSADQLTNRNPLDIDSQSQSPQQKASYILVVTRNGHMAEPVMDYAVNVADRLKYKILAAHINTLPFYHDGGRRSGLFASAMEESALLFQEKAKAKALDIEHIGDAGKIGKVVKRLCHSDKRIEFIVIDQGIRREEVASQAPVPVFSVNYTQPKAGQQLTTTHHKPARKGASIMSTTSRKRHAKSCLVFGGLTAGIYAAIFANQEIVMTYFTKGGLYALLPVATVFAVSYAHGNFTSSFWSALGIEGSKTTSKQAEVRKDTTDRPEIRKDVRPRAELNV